MRQRTSSLRESIRSPYAAAQAPASGMQNEMLSALNSLKRIVEANKQTNLDLQASHFDRRPSYAPQNAQQSIHDVIDELQESLNQLPLNDGPTPFTSQQGQRTSIQPQAIQKAHAFRHQFRPRHSEDEFEQTLSEIEARQLEIAQGIKRPQAGSGKPFTYSHPQNLHQVNADKARSRSELELLKRDISTISSALNDKTPRLQINELVTMVEDLGSQVKNAARHNPTLPQVENYGSQLEDILNRLDSLKPLANLVGIDIEIQKLSKKLESFRGQELDLPDAAALSDQMASLRKDFAHSRQAEQINAVSENVKDLSLQIANLWELANQKNAKIIRLEDKIDLFRKREETIAAPSGENAPLYQEFRELKTFVEKAVTSPKSNDNDDFRSLETKIDTLAGILNNPRHYSEEPVNASQGQDTKVVALEQMLNAVVMKLDAIQSSSQASKGSINQLETMLLALAQKIDQTEGHFSRLNSLENQLSNIAYRQEALPVQEPRVDYTSQQIAQSNYIEPTHNLPVEIRQNVAPHLATAPPKRALDRLMQRIQPQGEAYQPHSVSNNTQQAAQQNAYANQSNKVTFSKPLETGHIPSDLPLDVGTGSPVGKNLNSMRLNLNDSMPQAKISADPAYIKSQDAKNNPSKLALSMPSLKPYKKGLIIGLVATLVLFGGLAFIKSLRTPSGQQTISLNSAPKTNYLPPAKESATAKIATVQPSVQKPDAPLFDPIATGSVSQKAVPQAAPGVAVTHGWQSVTQKPSEKITPAMLAKNTASVKEIADQGNSGAQYDYANRLMEGAGVQRNPQEAFNYFKKAADASLVPAHFKLASLYEKGIGTAKNLSEARRHYLAAASKGHAKAMHNLAVVSADNSDGNGDVKVAALWFRRAAEHGITDSQFNLAILYARGQGVEQSLVESYKWFALAAKRGDKDAAQKKEQLEKRLPPESLSVVKMAVETFTPKQEPAGINSVQIPQGNLEMQAPKIKNNI